MGTYFKLPPKQCEDCGYSASGSAFVKSFGRWYYGKEMCPVCKSHNIIANLQRALPPPPSVKI